MKSRSKLFSVLSHYLNWNPCAFSLRLLVLLFSSCSFHSISKRIKDASLSSIIKYHQQSYGANEKWVKRVLQILQSCNRFRGGRSDRFL